jgi:hypothetical protein
VVDVAAPDPTPIVLESGPHVWSPSGDAALVDGGLLPWSDEGPGELVPIGGSPGYWSPSGTRIASRRGVSDEVRYAVIDRGGALVSEHDREGEVAVAEFSPTQDVFAVATRPPGGVHQLVLLDGRSDGPSAPTVVGETFGGRDWYWSPRGDALVGLFNDPVGPAIIPLEDAAVGAPSSLGIDGLVESVHWLGSGDGIFAEVDGELFLYPLDGLTPGAPVLVSSAPVAADYATSDVLGRWILYFEEVGVVNDALAGDVIARSWDGEALGEPHVLASDAPVSPGFGGRWHAYREVHWTNDGQTLYARLGGNPAGGLLYRFDLSGTVPVGTLVASGIGWFDVSPDEARLAYHTDDDELFTIDLPDGEARLLDGEAAGPLAFSPDGQNIAHACHIVSDLCVDGRAEVTRSASTSEISTLSWRPEP